MHQEPSSISQIARLVDALERIGGLTLVVTGAGVSAASGIRTFRGLEPDAVWSQHDVSLATEEAFWRDPAAQLHWYLERFAAVDTATPNAGHRSLAALERRLEAGHRGFLLVTQNVDTLHERAGSKRLIKVHGTVDRLRCASAGCPLGAPTGSIARVAVDLEAFRDAPSAATLPRCPRCATPLRAHVLFFDEYYGDHADYRYDEVEAAAQAAELMLFIGTSFSVGVTSLLLQAGSRRAVPMFSVDPGPARLPGAIPVEHVQAHAELFLPAVVQALGEF